MCANFGNDNHYYLHLQQTLQIYVRVSHSVNEDTATADFDPPFTDPLIDEIFIEANVSAVPFPNTFLVITETYTVTGDFETATLTMGVNARCAENYFGDGCEMLCNADGNNCDTGENTIIIQYLTTSYSPPHIYTQFSLLLPHPKQ